MAWTIDGGVRYFSAKGLVTLMRKYFALSLSFIACVVAITGGAASAQHDENRDPTAIYSQAGATPDQVQKIREMAKEFEQSATVKFERAKNLTKKMQDLSMLPMPDEKTVLATQDEINTLQTDLNNSRIKLMMKIRSLLNDEQRSHLVDLMKQRTTTQQPTQ